MKKSKFIAPLIALLMATGIGAGVVSCGNSDDQGDDTPVVPEKTLDSIEVKTQPTKTVYEDGEAFDPTGLVISAVYSDGTKEDVALDQVSFNKTTLAYGDTAVRATYQRKTVDIPVTVKAIAVTGLELNFESVELELNETKSVVATVTPDNASVKDVEFTTSSAAIATVSAGGEIKGIAPGTATITVTTKGEKADGTKISKTVAVTVKDVYATRIELGQENVTIKEGVTAQITYEIIPSNVADKTVRYASEDTSVATVSDSGLITGVSVGETNITVTTNAKNSDGNSLVASVHVTVISSVIKNQVEFQNDDGSILEIKNGLDVGEEFTYTGAVPSKKGEDHVYVFRGFDKEIVPYEESEETIVYKAIYEEMNETPRLVTLTKEVAEDESEHVIMTVTGEAKGVTTETMANKAWLCYTNRFGNGKGSQWGNNYSPALSPIVAADGTYTMQTEVTDDLAPEYESEYMMKYVWNRDAAGSPVDLKVHNRQDLKRYRHTAEGEVVEVNTLPDDWDGVTGLDGTPEKFRNAIPAPTWVGLGVTFEDTTITVGNKEYTLFTNEDNWNLVSLKIKNSDYVTVESVDKAAFEINADNHVSVTVKGKVAVTKLKKAKLVLKELESDEFDIGDDGSFEATIENIDSTISISSSSGGGDKSRIYIVAGDQKNAIPTKALSYETEITEVTGTWNGTTTNFAFGANSNSLAVCTVASNFTVSALGIHEVDGKPYLSVQGVFLGTVDLEGLKLAVEGESAGADPFATVDIPESALDGHTIHADIDLTSIGEVGNRQLMFINKDGVAGFGDGKNRGINYFWTSSWNIGAFKFDNVIYNEELRYTLSQTSDGKARLSVEEYKGFDWKSADIVEEDGKAIYKVKAEYFNYTKAELEGWTFTFDFQANGYDGGSWGGSWDRHYPTTSFDIDEVALTLTLNIDVTDLVVDEYIGHLSINYTGEDITKIGDFKPGFSYDKTATIGGRTYRAFCVDGSGEAADCYGCLALEIKNA